MLVGYALEGEENVQRITDETKRENGEGKEIAPIPRVPAKDACDGLVSKFYSRRCEYTRAGEREEKAHHYERQCSMQVG